MLWNRSTDHFICVGGTPLIRTPWSENTLTQGSEVYMGIFARRKTIEWDNESKWPLHKALRTPKQPPRVYTHSAGSLLGGARALDRCVPPLEKQ